MTRAEPCGVTHVSSLSLRTVAKTSSMFDSSRLKEQVIGDVNPVPVKVITVPPDVGPAAGKTLVKPALRTIALLATSVTLDDVSG
mmetsp:Transcript_12323/g.40481  ORF Transcript_12323/g.40481 Transcript_12323/m.40481 type:complete len:85 (+) Transcript_12323:2133-2387(+)